MARQKIIGYVVSWRNSMLEDVAGEPNRIYLGSATLFSTRKRQI